MDADTIKDLERVIAAAKSLPGGDGASGRGSEVGRVIVRPCGDGSINSFSVVASLPKGFDACGAGRTLEQAIGQCTQEAWKRVHKIAQTHRSIAEESLREAERIEATVRHVKTAEENPERHAPML